MSPPFIIRAYQRAGTEAQALSKPNTSYPFVPPEQKRIARSALPTA